MIDGCVGLARGCRATSAHVFRAICRSVDFWNDRLGCFASKAVTPVQMDPTSAQLLQNTTKTPADDLTLEQQHQRRCTLLNQKRHERRKRMIMAAKIRIEEQQPQPE
ncbi:unnamed protein product [Didymodactylos carnosus]|uniref:Uncharacterized protein n=1 Tax=Didymodactylos carnosus TaxID=1234261 RepID=A0A8S2DXB6_9BILA|nr:unnamed protein product [Didymodactylos carnosus]CAF3768896.1 unnamed protein product [Didymodactylos carnosus]